ncbi:hypothetical protein Efla_005921 [Eimeria flavescens]
MPLPKALGCLQGALEGPPVRFQRVQQAANNRLLCFPACSPSVAVGSVYSAAATSTASLHPFQMKRASGRLHAHVSLLAGKRVSLPACFSTHFRSLGSPPAGGHRGKKKNGDQETDAAGVTASPQAATGLEAALFAELSNHASSNSFSGRRLQRLAAATAAQGIRDPRVWAVLSARAMELNVSSRPSSEQTAGQADSADAPQLGPAGQAKGDAQASEGTGSCQQETKGSELDAPRGFRHFEALQFLSSFLSAGFKDTDLLISFDQIFLRQLHAFECRHLIQLLHICEQHSHRPRGLYAPLFKSFAVQAPQLLFQEIADVFCCFAAHRVGSSSCCVSLLRAAAAQVPNSSLSDATRFCGALNALGLAGELDATGPLGSARESAREAVSSRMKAEEAAATVLALVEQRIHFLVDGLPLQLLLDEVQRLPNLEFSWRPYEGLAKKTLLKRLSELECAEDVEQLADPFATMQFLRAQGCLHQPFLKAMIRWCAAAAHKPPTRSQKRPTAEELVMLHDACREYGIADDERLQKAIVKFVSTKGGTARNKRFVSPLEYQRNRRYYYLPDLRAGCTPAVS